MTTTGRFQALLIGSSRPRRDGEQSLAASSEPRQADAAPEIVAPVRMIGKDDSIIQSSIVLSILNVSGNRKKIIS